MIELLISLALALGPVEDLIAAERAFSRMSVDRNTHDAFVRYLARDAIMFRNGPINGQDRLRSNPMPRELWLKWEPLVVDVSQSGDFGYSTGPFERGTRGKPPAGKGYFVTVWEKDPQRGWLVALDVGLDTPNALPVDSAPRLVRQATQPANARPAAAATADSLVAIDRDFADFAKASGSNRAYTKYLAENARVYRDFREPTQTRADGLKLLQAQVPAVWKPTTGGIARSRDLGYTYGRFDGRVNGSYVRIWRHTADGWRIVVDITNVDQGN